MKIEISKEISSRISEILDRTPDLVAALAGQYSQDAFTEKAFDGNPWPLNKDPKRQGSELIRSGKLRGSMSIKVERSPGNSDKVSRVIISYGNSHVPYAQVHNEGFDGEVTVPDHIRHTKRGDVQVRRHTRHMKIPQRQFLGPAEELDQLLKTEIEAMINDVFSK